ncbi:hypothetical protein [Kitasatospora aureofaciens]|nr:hypothetical protein [Kitasatospora aureofaciens]
MVSGEAPARRRTDDRDEKAEQESQARRPDAVARLLDHAGAWG